MKPKTLDWEWMMDSAGELIPLSRFPKTDTITKLRPEEIQALEQKYQHDPKTCEKFRADWAEFISKYREGDEFIHHTSSQADWRAMMGTEGYAIFREGFAVAFIMTRMN